MKNIGRNKRLPKIIAAILISAFAGGLTKNFLFPSDTVNSFVNHTKVKQNDSQHNVAASNQSLMGKVRQLCPDCENQIQILNKIMQEHPEAIAIFKKHFDKLTKEDLQSLVKNFDIKTDMDSTNTNSSSNYISSPGNAKDDGQNNISKYTDMIKNNISNINFSDIKNKFNGLSSF
jgi:hypothetical protein